MPQVDYYNIPSFPSLFLPLYHNNQGKNIIIITINSSIQRICDHLDIKCIYIKGNYKAFGFRAFRKKLDRTILEAPQDSRFFLLDNAITIEGFYIAKEWKNKNGVYYSNLSSNFQSYYDFKATSHKRFQIHKSIIEKYFGLNLCIRIQSGSPLLGIDDKFILKNRINILKLPLSYSKIQELVIHNNQIEQKNYDILIVLQGSMKGIIKQGSIDNILAAVSNCQKNVVIKEHPYHKSSNNSGFKNFYPDYIPCEFLLKNINKCVISVFSLTLFQAVLFKHLKVISLLELLDWEDVQFKSKTKETIIKRTRNAVLFPQNLDELFTLIGYN